MEIKLFAIALVAWEDKILKRKVRPYIALSKAFNLDCQRNI